MKTTALDRYKKAKEALINHFAKKQGFGEWYESGHILCFGDYFFSIEDIVYDIEANCKVGNILKWHDEQVEATDTTLNYRTYCMGLTFAKAKELRELAKTKKRIEEKIESLKQCINETK